MTYEELKARTTPGPLHPLPFDDDGGYEGMTGAVAIAGTDGRIVAELDERHAPIIAAGYDAPLAYTQRQTRLVATAAMLSHCYNHFVEVVAALERRLVRAESEYPESQWDEEGINADRRILERAKEVHI